jgi:hypothetical protein
MIPALWLYRINQLRVPSCRNIPIVVKLALWHHFHFEVMFPRSYLIGAIHAWKMIVLSC